MNALANANRRILIAAVSEGRRADLGAAGLFAVRYETRHGHDPRMRRSCQSHDVPRWSMCRLQWSLHVVHEFVLLKVSVREHRARLECCVDGYERL